MASTTVKTGARLRVVVVARVPRAAVAAVAAVAAAVAAGAGAPLLLLRGEALGLELVGTLEEVG